ncbi:MAG: HAMP domain-containing sensor histidine kinase [Ginsengibacter sp.]
MQPKGTVSPITKTKPGIFIAADSHLSDAVLDSLVNQIVVINRIGIIQKVNRAWYLFNKIISPGSGYDFIGADYFEICACADGPYAADTARALAGVRSVLDGRQERFEMEYVTVKAKQEKHFLLEVVSLGIMGATVVHTDVTERKTDEKFREQFFAIASHELKTPITSLKGIAHIFKISFGKKISREGARMLGIMEIQLNKLTKIIEDLVVINSRPGRDIILQKEVFNFSTLLRQTVQNVRSISPLHFLTIEENEEVIKYTGDKFRLEQVLTNLLTNAVKYSPQANHIIIRLLVKDNCVQFSVRDFGIGIEKEDSKKIFEKFYRINNEDRFIGLGLGLYISSQIIKAHKGNLWVESEKGKGSTFYFTLPLDQK